MINPIYNPKDVINVPSLMSLIDFVEIYALFADFKDRDAVFLCFPLANQT